MKQAAMALAVAAAAAVMATPVRAQLSGFAQLRQVQRVHSLPDCAAVDGCTAMTQDALGELLYERRFGDRLGAALRVEASYDNAISEGRAALREGFVDWEPSAAVNLKLGRQVLTWGVSDYLYVNDVFPKNYDAFFTGAGFDRMKEPVDAARLAAHGAAADAELVVSRSKADRMPRADRFSAMAMTAGAMDVDDADDSADLALKASGHAGGWDLAAYAATFRARERRYAMDAAGLIAERPRTQHLGLSITGNFAGGILWAEGALRRTAARRSAVVSRHSLGSAAKLIAGYSREAGEDRSVSVQWQLEAPTSRDRYVESLAPGVRALRRITSTLHLRVHGRWINQTLGAGAQLFAGSEGDSHFNPFVSWSPADGWTLEGGANMFNGKPDTRYGAFRGDSNVYALGRYSF